MSNRANASCRSRGIAGSLLLALCACLIWGGAAAVAATLPDGRSYELVTPLEKNGVEVGTGVPSIDGNAVDWQAPGGCCGATSAAQTLYQSSRTGSGWQTKALTPTPNRPLVGVTEEQNPVFWTGDLSQTIFSTPASYVAGDERPSGSGDLDLYLQGPSGSMSWLSQGPFAGSGSAPDSATFDGATPDASHVVFSSAAQLTPEATGLSTELNEPGQYLYERDVAEGDTKLINVVNTTLAAAVRGRIATALAADATGTTTTSLSTSVGPAVATELTAAATGHVSSTLTAAASAGETSIAMASTAGFAANEQIAIDAGEEQETATIEAVTDATHLTLSGGLAFNHAAGATVAYGGDATIAVGNTAGLARGEQIAIDTGGLEESATIAAVLDQTELLLSAGLTNDHASGAAVAHAADTSIALASTEGFAAGQSIAIDPGTGSAESATVAAVTDATHLELTAAVASVHGEGAQVTHDGDSSIAVASTAGLAAGDPLTIDVEGAQQETVRIASIPDGTHLTLDAPLASGHAAGAPVVYGGDTSLTVASTANVKAGESVRVDTGAAEETRTVVSVTDATHLVLGAGLTHGHAAGATVAQLVGPAGAILGNGAYIGHPFLPANTTGTTTDAISSDGSKIFFESPPPPGFEYGIQTHLYMRDVREGTTTALDNPQAYRGSAHYEGASKDGSLVFFTSDEGLAGEPSGTAEPFYHVGFNELYEFNTTDRQIGPAPPMSAIPVSGGGLGTDTTTLTAHAYGQVKTEVTGIEEVAPGSTSLPVASTAGFRAGESIEINNPQQGRNPSQTATIAAVADATHLALAAPLEQPVSPTVPVIYTGERSLTVASTAGFLVGEILEVEGEETQVEAVVDATHLALSGGPDPEFSHGLDQDHPVGAQLSAATKAVSGSVIGVTAIATDGSHVYFVAENILATNSNSRGQTPKWHQPNLYMFDTASGRTTFIVTLASADVNNCLPHCAQVDPYIQSDQSGGLEGNADGLVAEPDVNRPAVPTPDGSVLVFDSSGDLTGEDAGPATTLTAEVEKGERTIAVASTKGFAVGHTITIGTGIGEELEVIESIPDATHLVLSEIGPAGLQAVVIKHAAGTVVAELHSELYRYDANDESLTCVSCTPAGVTPTGSATLGAAGGGSYAPPGLAVPISEDGSKVFFQTPDPLVSGDVNGGSFANGPFGSTAESSDVYEWENGKVSLISDGRSTAGAFLDGTTPSGNDVFLTTRAPLVSADADGYTDIYDARVGGGFAEPATGPAPCSGQNCRPRGASVFFSVPASATLTGAGNLKPQNAAAPSFTVAAISASQRAKAAKSGALALSVSATAGGRLSAKALASVHGKSESVGSASVTLAKAGKATLTLRLSKAARKALAKSGRLALRIEVSYSESGTVKVATLTLKSSQAKARRRA